MLELINLKTGEGVTYESPEPIYHMALMEDGVAVATRNVLRTFVLGTRGSELILEEKASWKAPGSLDALTSVDSLLYVGVSEGKLVCFQSAGRDLREVFTLQVEGVVPEVPPTIWGVNWVRDYLLVAGGSDGGCVYQWDRKSEPKLIWTTKAMCARELFLVTVQGRPHVYATTWHLYTRDDQILPPRQLLYGLDKSPDREVVVPQVIPMSARVLGVAQQGNAVWHLLEDATLGVVDFDRGEGPVKPQWVRAGCKPCAFALDEGGTFYLVGCRKDGVVRARWESGKDSLSVSGRALELSANTEWVQAARVSVRGDWLGILWK